MTRNDLWPAVAKIFFVSYLLIVAACTLLPLHYAGPPFAHAYGVLSHVQLVPFAKLHGITLKQGMLNILLFLPFGFGLPFAMRTSFRGLLGFAALASLTIELTQLALVAIYFGAQRFADINDVIFNVTGAVIGYGVFALLGVAFRRAARGKTFAPSSLADFIRRAVAPQA